MSVSPDFVLDEWDAIFNMPFIKKKDKLSYLSFLKNMLKGKVYVSLAYMTGILPIAKYLSGSELNMFLEYAMSTKEKYSEYFGFLDEEVDILHERYLKQESVCNVSREGLREWYDGYQTLSGQRLYNPRSVVCALKDNQLSNYWTSSVGTDGFRRGNSCQSGGICGYIYESFYERIVLF